MQLKFKKTLASLLILTPLIAVPAILLLGPIVSIDNTASPIIKSTKSTKVALTETVTDAWTTNGTNIVKVANGDIYSWGWNGEGATGVGGTENILTPTLLLDASDPTQSKGALTNLAVNDTITDAWTTEGTVIAKTTNGDVYSWGYGGDGNTGLDKLDDVLTPELLLDTSNPTQSKGNFNSLPVGNTIEEGWTMNSTFYVKTTNDNVYSWGLNDFGQAGVDTSDDVLSPTLILDAITPGSSKGEFDTLTSGDTITDIWTTISTDYNTVFAKTTNGEIFTWGWNQLGTTGLGIYRSGFEAPTLLLNPSDPTQSPGDFDKLSIGDTIIDMWTMSYNVVAKTTNGDVFSWGGNYYGGTGLDGSSVERTPKLLLDASDPTNSSGAFESLSANETIIDAWRFADSIITKTTNEDIYAWGYNGQGQTGNGDTDDVMLPILVIDVSDPTQSFGDFKNLAIGETITDAWMTIETVIAKTTNGDIYSWGWNKYGQTGLGGETDDDGFWSDVLTPTLLLDVSDPTKSKGDFTTLPIDNTITSVWVSQNTWMVKTTNGDVFSWGYNEEGDAGLGTANNASIPTLLYDTPIKVEDPVDPVVPVAPKDPVTPEVPSASSGGMSTGALVGIIVGSIVGVAVIGFGVWWYIKKIK